MAAFLVDTNVLVYAYDPSDRAKQAIAREVLMQLATDRNGALSVQVLGEFFSALVRKASIPLTPSQAERRVVNFLRTWEVLPITASTVREAISISLRRQMSYWDGLIWAAAKLGDIPNVLTEDQQSGDLIEGVRYLNPFVDTFDLALLS